MSRPEFKEGIYNYCDYICEKCAYTDKCYLYWSERHPDEAKKDLEKASDRMEEVFGEEVFEVDEDWQESFEEKQKREQEEERSKRIIAPAKEIIDIAHPMLKELSPDYNESSERLRDAVDKIATNYMLISAKYYRAVHNLPENADEMIDEIDYWGLTDSENTFLAMKGFIWNLKDGCRLLVSELPEYEKKCKNIIELADLIFNRIESEHLPLVQKLIRKNRDRFESDS